jgi:hypothetical protein
MGELIKTINPIIRGWGNYYCRSQVRKRFHQLDGWIVRRLWSHRAKRWRNSAPGIDGVTWQTYGENLEEKLENLHDKVHRGSCARYVLGGSNATTRVHRPGAKSQRSAYKKSAGGEPSGGWLVSFFRGF